MLESNPLKSTMLVGGLCVFMYGLLLPVSVTKHSFSASLGHATQRQKPLSSLWFGVFQANIPKGLLLCRSVFSPDTGIISTTYVSIDHNIHSYCVFETCSYLWFKWKLLKCLLDHPMKYGRVRYSIARPRRSMTHVPRIQVTSRRACFCAASCEKL